MTAGPKRRLRPGLTIFLFAVIGTAVGLYMYQRQRLARMERAKVSPVQLHERMIARAVVVPLDGTAHVRSRIDGRVLRVLVREGDRVEKGMLLAELDPGSMQSELSLREAERRALDAQAQSIAQGARPEERNALAAEERAVRAELAQAQDRADRLAKLLAAGGANEAQVSEAKQQVEIIRARLQGVQARVSLARAGGRAADVTAAKERIAAADAAIEQVRERIERTKIVSPIAGVVIARRVDPGDNVAPGADAVTVTGSAGALFEIADTTRTELRLEIEENDALAVHTGLRVVVRAPGGGREIGAGVLGRLAERLERRTIGAHDARERAEALVRAGWVQWEGAAPQNGLLAVGQRLEVAIELPARNVPAAVPRQAVTVRDGRAMVRVPNELLGFASETRVEIGSADEQWVEVNGLPVGSTVLVGP